MSQFLLPLTLLWIGLGLAFLQASESLSTLEHAGTNFASFVSTVTPSSFSSSAVISPSLGRIRVLGKTKGLNRGYSDGCKYREHLQLSQSLPYLSGLSIRLIFLNLHHACDSEGER